MTPMTDELAHLVAQVLPLQVSPPGPGQQSPVWHVPDEDPRRVEAVLALAEVARQQPEQVRQAIAAYRQQYGQTYPQQPVQLTWTEGTPQPALFPLAEMMLEMQDQG